MQHQRDKQQQHHYHNNNHRQQQQKQKQQHSSLLLSATILYNLRPQLRLILVALCISLFLTLVMDNVVYGEPLVGSSGTNDFSSMLNPFVDQHMIKILNEAMMGIRSPESQNQTIKSHSMYFDKNRNVVFVPSKDDSSVHKFHPNGRYGRRSLPLGAGESPSAHSEFGQERSSRVSRDGALRELLMARNNMLASNNNNNNNNNNDDDDAIRISSANNLNSLINGMELGNVQQEMSKILKCDYTGIANLYYCEL